MVSTEKLPTLVKHRVEIDEKKMQLTKNADGSYNFSIEMKNFRNNFEIMLVGLSLDKQLHIRNHSLRKNLVINQ